MELNIIIIIIFFIIFLVKKRKRGEICYGSSNRIGHKFKGECPMMSTGDPLIFGPTIWPSLHIIAENYPENLDQKHKDHCYNFLKGLPYMLPCGYCGHHLLNEETTRKGQIGDNLDLNLRNACSSRDKLRDFFVEAHNNVNSHNLKDKWSSEDVKEYYSKVPACIYNNTGWFEGESL